jgi:4-hydroxy-3-polyprenylbenzoate decarboxylase
VTARESPRRRTPRGAAPARESPRRLVVAITGATGAIYGVRLLQALRGSDVETHLVVSRWGARTLVHETPFTLEQVRRLAGAAYSPDDQGAAPASGSFLSAGMVVAPCSMRTLAAIAQGQADDLVRRAADVVLKERRRLVLLVRETPLSEIHLENMLKLARMGVVICPPVPAFYGHPRSLDDVVNQTVQRVLDLFDVHLDVAQRWSGEMGVGGAPAAVARAVARRSRVAVAAGGPGRPSRRRPAARRRRG